MHIARKILLLERIASILNFAAQLRQMLINQMFHVALIELADVGNVAKISE